MSHTTVNTKVGEFISDCIVARERSRLPVYASPPVVHEEGSTYFNTTNNISYLSDGVNWIPTNSARYARHITVDQNGIDHDNIEDAILEAISLSPTASNGVQIMIYPGTYTAINPIIVPSYVTITSHADMARELVVVEASSPLANVFVMSDQSGIDGLTIKGGIASISNSSSGITYRISDCTFMDATYGIYVVGANSKAIVYNCSAISDTTSIVWGFAAINGAILYGRDLVSRSLGLTTTYGFATLGVQARLFLEGCVAENCTNGFYTLSSGGRIDVIGGRSMMCPTGVYIGSNSVAVLQSHSILFTDLTYTAINLASSTAEIYGTANRFSKTNITRVSGSTFQCSFYSDTPGDFGFNIRGELQVGDVFTPTESVFGEGDSYTDGMRVFHGISTGSGDDGSSFTEITSDVNINGDGNTSNAFPALTANSTLFIYSQHASFEGIKILLTAGLTGSGSEAFLEYWNGSLWSPARMMSTDSEFPYQPFAGIKFNIGTFQYRFGLTSTPMAIKTLNSATGYWCRFRLTGSISPMPVIDQIKIHSNRMEINKDGFVELFGKAEIRKQIPFDTNWFKPLGVNPSNRGFYVADDMYVGKTLNSFENGIDTVVGTQFLLPPNVDTSKLLKFIVRFWTDELTAGNVLMRMKLSRVADILDEPGALSDLFRATSGAPPTAPGLIATIDQVISFASGNDDKLRSFKFDVDISSLVLSRTTGSELGDMLVFTISRIGSDTVTDTYPGALTIVNITPIAVEWSNGAPRTDI